MAPPSAPASPSAADCLFCRIAAGEIAADIVLADDVVVGFLDHRPIFPGHTLVVPRVHAVTLVDLPAPALGPYFERVQRVAAAVETALGAAGSFVGINNKVSQSVAHLHTHVVPRRPKDGLRGFFWPRSKYAPGEAAAVAERLRAVLGQSEQV